MVARLLDGTNLHAWGPCLLLHLASCVPGNRLGLMKHLCLLS